ncbi:MAG: hypothetical protein AAGA23_08390 [Pseudomonadota bacterium]
MSFLRRAAFLSFVFLLSLDAQGVEHQYQIRVNPERTRLTVTARLAAPQRTIRSSNASTADFLIAAKSCEGQRLDVDGRRIRLPRDVTCLRYEYDLAAAARRSATRRRTQLRPGIVVTSPGDWLFRPRLTEGTTLRIAWNLPQGDALSVPWTRLDDKEHVYELGSSPRSADAIVAFGNFDYQEVEVPGATLRIGLLHEAAGPMDQEKLVEWLRQAAIGVTQAHGRFPNPSPQVLLVPSRSTWGSSPVPFGRVVRNGGESVQFFVDPDRKLDDYLKDWTATHEFAHLLLPYVGDRWVSEGFASYYQNVLMARSGHYTEGTAWAKLHAGIERARAVRPRGSPTTSRSRMMVYWSGAALALVADVRLRRLSGGEESLDKLLSRLGACCLPSDRSWDAEEFFLKLDSLSDYSVFSETYRELANRPGVPKLDALYRSLGIVPTSDRTVQVTDSAPEAALRRSLMLGPPNDT